MSRSSVPLGGPIGTAEGARMTSLYGSIPIPNSTGGNSSMRVDSDEPRNDSRASDESRAAKALIRAMNTLTFDVRGFAFSIAISPLAIRKRFLSICIGFIVMQCSKYDTAGSDSSPEEFEFLVECKRMQDVMMAYSIKHNEFM